MSNIADSGANLLEPLVAADRIVHACRLERQHTKVNNGLYRQLMHLDPSLYAKSIA